MKGGDRVMTFEQIYNTYFRAVYRYVRQISGDEHIAEEITSETFLKAIDSIENFHGDCEIRVWLCQIAKNTYYTYLRKSKKIVNIDEVYLQNMIDTDSSMDVQVEKKEDVAQIRSILHKLSDPYKEVFMWRIFGELSFKEIGALYSKTENWACVTYHRARKMIQNRLEESNYEK